MTKLFDVLLIGHIDKGRIILDSQIQGSAGGAVYFAGMVYLAFGLKLGILTRLAREDVELLTELQENGACVFPVFVPKTTAIDNLLSKSFPHKRRLICRGFAGTFQSDDLPPASARIFHLGTIMPDEIDLSFLRAVAERGPVALDAQGCLRRLVGDELVISNWSWANQALPLVEYLKVDEDEARVLAGKDDYLEAVENLGGRGPREIILTHSRGVVVWHKGKVHKARFCTKTVLGRSGRGDTCFATYLSRRLLGDSPEEATRFAAALTSLKLERSGPFRGSLKEVHHLLELV